MRFLNVDIKNVTEQELLQQLRRGVLITPNVDQMGKLQWRRKSELQLEADICPGGSAGLCSGA